MKNRLLIVAALLGIFSSLAYAQRDLEQLSQNPRIKQYRIAVFTEVLQLTPEEAQAFWPVYNKYMDDKEALRKSGRMNKPLDNLSDKEIEEQIQKHFTSMEQGIVLERKLVEDLRPVLPVRKIAKLKQAEREFRTSLLKKLQEARSNREGHKGNFQGRRGNFNGNSDGN